MSEDEKKQIRLHISWLALFCLAWDELYTVIEDGHEQLEKMYNEWLELTGYKPESADDLLIRLRKRLSDEI